MHLDETIPTADWDRTPHEVAATDGHLHAVNPIFDPVDLAKRMTERWADGIYGASVGSMDGWNLDVLFPDIIDDDPKLIGQLDFDEFMASSTDATSTKGVDATNLSKIWHIDHKDA